MRFYVTERELFEDLESAETLADYIRTGINRYSFTYKGARYDAWEMATSSTVRAYNYKTNETEELNGNIKAKLLSWDLDEDGYRVGELQIVEQ